jgi:hypothetical protein
MLALFSVPEGGSRNPCNSPCITLAAGARTHDLQTGDTDLPACVRLDRLQATYPLKYIQSGGYSRSLSPEIDVVSDGDGLTHPPVNH